MSWRTHMIKNNMQWRIHVNFFYLFTCLGMYFPFSLRILLRMSTWLHWEHLTWSMSTQQYKWIACVFSKWSPHCWRVRTCQKPALRSTSYHSEEGWTHNDESPRQERWWRQWATPPRVGCWSPAEAPVQPYSLVAYLRRNENRHSKSSVREMFSVASRQIILLYIRPTKVKTADGDTLINYREDMSSYVSVSTLQRGVLSVHVTLTLASNPASFR